MLAKFDAIMKDVLNTRNDWVKDFAALVRLGRFIIEHRDLLRSWMASLGREKPEE